MSQVVAVGDGLRPDDSSGLREGWNGVRGVGKRAGGDSVGCDAAPGEGARPGSLDEFVGPVLEESHVTDELLLPIKDDLGLGGSVEFRRGEEQSRQVNPNIP
ncbi:hypothetical protein CKAH01_06432 [Colletotrichum kahawae]|uniref:Uncharacterized protein n=1 Tax=Colletotrichum kahawae TaxID=34407 RepID=A0AAE0D3V5_COLKA|nr:hypothetical protein CKAH01_06432 [Colletotrichum kahawae]